MQNNLQITDHMKYDSQTLLIYSFIFHLFTINTQQELRCQGPHPVTLPWRQACTKPDQNSLRNKVGESTQ